MADRTGAAVGTLTSTEITVLVIVVVLAVVVVGLLLLMMRRLRQRRAQLLHELRDRPELVQDRAFNRIAMARKEADLLARQGGDPGRARETIAEAQAAFDNRNYERAYQSAQIAHEALVNSRGGVRLPRAPSGAGPAGAPALPVSAPSVAAATPPAPAIPRNRAESQFQLRILDQELATAKGQRPRARASVEAAELRNRAQSAFDRAEFTEAFRLALKGRRALGGPLETLPPTAAPRTDGPAGLPGGVGPDPSDPTQTAEQVSGGQHCPECGYPAMAGDAFCRGCGAPRTPSACGQCGAPRTPADTFCGRCGAKFV
jgi:hypothetical protein